MIKHIKKKYINPILVKNKQKIFCIGRNKTGTTSLKKAFADLGYIVGHQRTAERLILEYEAGNFETLIKYCKTAEVFQDAPFSYPQTYKYLDKAYPGSKFILTVRDNPDVWYASVTNFHAKRFGNGKIPSSNILKEADYIWKGWIWESIRINYNTPESDPYQKDLVIKNYIDHNRDVKEYFRDRPDDLLIINLSEPNSYQEFIKFLGVDSPYENFPWENKTNTK